jgi:hypothetical protein
MFCTLMQLCRAARASDLKVLTMLLPFVFFIAIALAIWFIFFSEASLRAKIIVGLLFVASTFLRYSQYTSLSLAGLFLQIGVSIFIAIYVKVQAG